MRPLAAICLCAAVVMAETAPASPVWPRAGIPLGVAVPADALDLLSWSPRGDAMLVQAATGLLLVTPAGVRQVGTLGHESALGAWAYGTWLADGRWITVGGGPVGFVAIDATGQSELVSAAGLEGRVHRAPKNSASRVLLAAVGPAKQVMGAWMVASGRPGAQAVPLPVVAGACVASLGWTAEDALEATLVLESERDLPHGRRHVTRQRSLDQGATWTPVPGGRQPPRGPFSIGRMSVIRLEDATSWILPDGRSMAVSPALPEADGTAELPVPPATELVISTADGTQLRRSWPAAGGDRPWPVALLPDGGVLAARHRRVRSLRAAPWTMWEPVVEGWGILDADGVLRSIDIPDLSRINLLPAADRSLLVYNDISPCVLLAAKPGEPTRDLAAALGLEAGWCADQAGRSGGAVTRALALLVRPAASLKCEGPRQLFAWSGSATPTLLHRSQGRDDAVSAMAWDADGRRLAWLQGGVLRVWNAGDPGQPLSAERTVTDF